MSRTIEPCMLPPSSAGYAMVLAAMAAGVLAGLYLYLSAAIRERRRAPRPQNDVGEGRANDGPRAGVPTAAGDRQGRVAWEDGGLAGAMPGSSGGASPTITIGDRVLDPFVDEVCREEESLPGAASLSDSEMSGCSEASDEDGNGPDQEREDVPIDGERSNALCGEESGEEIEDETARIAEVKREATLGDAIFRQFAGRSDDPSMPSEDPGRTLHERKTEAPIQIKDAPAPKALFGSWFGARLPRSEMVANLRPEESVHAKRSVKTSGFGAASIVHASRARS